MKNFKFSSSANGKVFRNGLYSTAILAAAIVLAVLINLLVGAIPKRYTEFDLSAAKMYTLGDSSRQLMQSLDQDVTVYYLCETGSEDAIITKLLDHYADESGHFHWEQKDPALYPTFAAQYGAENASTGSLIVVSGENSEVLNAAELYEYDYSDYYTTGAANVTFGGEKQISSAIYKLTAAAESHAYYTTNHGEQALTSSLTEALKAQNIDAQPLDLLTGTIPEDCDLLIISNPASDFAADGLVDEIAQLQAYLENGGKVLLTTSGTTALEMAALLCGIQPGDEVILPSYTFSSTATAFVLAGAKLVFVDIRPDTMNIDEAKIEPAITEKTKVICVMHYAGVACDMDTIMQIARRHNLKVVEDAAQGVMASYKGKALGTIGDFGCYSFHETKNFSMGEGGALVINDPETVTKAEILREKGTNRASFLRGQVDKYTWVSYGSSYLPSDLNAAYLWAQLEQADTINTDRTHSWDYYAQELAPLAEAGLLELPTVPEGCVHNGHLFYVKLRDLEQRTEFIAYLKAHGVASSFHYVPLHSAPAGIQYGRFAGVDEYTTKESNRLTRLPLYYGLTEADRAAVVQVVKDFFAQK